MKKFRNNNEKYGDVGPFEATSKEALADEMADTFKDWAKEAQNDGDNRSIDVHAQRSA